MVKPSSDVQYRMCRSTECVKHLPMLCCNNVWFMIIFLQWQKQMVVAQSGIPSPGDMSYQAIPAQMKIFKESYNPSPKNSKAGFQNPKLTISLEAAYVSVVGLSPSQDTGSRISRMCTPCTFSVTTSEGTCYEFMAEKESDRLIWVTVLEFLSMFPYSSVPEVPRCNPLFRRDLDPDLYNAGRYTLKVLIICLMRVTVAWSRQCIFVYGYI